MNSNNNNNGENIRKTNTKKIIFKKSLSLFKKARILKKEIRKKNPNFSKFSLDSLFIYETIYYKNFYEILSNKNSMKPNKDQYNKLLSIYNELKAKFSFVNEAKFIEVKKDFYDYFFDHKPIIPKLSDEAINLQNLIKQLNKTSSSFSIRKLTNEYSIKFGKKLSKSKIYNILRYNLKYYYLKTCVKSSKASTITSKKQSFFALKIICRILLLNGTLIYVDESGFTNKSTNYKVWRKRNDNIYQKIKKQEKANLMLAVSSKKIYGYSLEINSTNSGRFKYFMENIVKNMTEEEKKKSVFFMDNLPAHKTLEMYQFYRDNKLKILFNSPYISNFNMVEYVFRFIKNITYKRLYNSLADLKKDIEEIIKSNQLRDSLEKLYKETLLNYINFVEENRYINLNI